jgi:hypothetical protein
MKDIYHSKKLSIPIRRIQIAKINYTVRPCFVMPYLAGFVDDVEKALFLRKFDVPFWAFSHVFGKDAMYWYRLEKSLGRNSIVGTTIKDARCLPKHLSADEKHTRIFLYTDNTGNTGLVQQPDKIVVRCAHTIYPYSFGDPAD